MERETFLKTRIGRTRIKMFIDYYALLEISQSATISEIKSAYRTQAMKWHPDKNAGFDTTDKMKELNEAKQILTDEEARVRYDKEYSKFKSFQHEKEANKKNEKTNTQNQESEAEQGKEKDFSYHFDDQILKKWVDNARKQAMRDVHEMVIEFRDNSILGFETFFKTALIAIAYSFIIFLILQLLKSL